MERTVALDPVAWKKIAERLEELGSRYRDLQQRILQALAQAGITSIGTQLPARDDDAGVLGGEVLIGRAGQELRIPLTLDEEEFAAVQEIAEELDIPLLEFP